MTADYWAQNAELHRKNEGQDLTPDVPIKGHTDKIADGTLSEMIDKWSAFPADERLKYVIHLGGGALADSTMEAMHEQPRT